MDYENRLIEILKTAGKPLTADDIFRELEDHDAAAAAVSRLLSSGRILMTRKKKLALPEQTGLIYGRIQGRPQGYGFFIPADGSRDAFVPADAMHGAMHGDWVWVRMSGETDRSGAQDAEVALVAERAYQRIVGTFERIRDDAYIVPDDRRISEDMLVLPADINGAETGDKVVAEVLSYSDGRRPMIGRVTEVLGNRHEAGTDVLSVVRRYGLPDAFSKEALLQAGACSPPDADTIRRREDLRGIAAVTIDGADAKDLDDAVSLQPLENGNFLLGVHIADVSHYVPEGTPLDWEARERGTSVYLLDRVLPMLPPELSNGVCSLNQGEDKLTLSCMIEVTPEGRAVNHRLAETVVRSRRRLTYENVNRTLAGDETLCREYADVLPMLRSMDALREKLYKKRMKRGGVDFEIAEADIRLDEQGRPVDIRARQRGGAERMIEEFMLLANETVARRLAESGVPCMYRVHEKPDRERIEELNVFLHTLGLGIETLEDVQPRTLQKILLSAKATPEENIVSRLTLRSMKKARYSERNLGHFGLAAEYYCHFTSPIRRYPDLTVHRIVKRMLCGGMDEERIRKTAERLPALANACSERERAAMEAERCVDDLKKCQYMQRHIGEVEQGIISGVAGFGFFVELPNTVEGVVRMASLRDDRYILEEKNYRIIGKRTKKVYRLGDPVTVRVTAADPDAGTVEFELEPAQGMENEKNAPPKQPGKKTGKGRKAPQGTKAGAKKAGAKKAARAGAAKRKRRRAKTH